MIRVWRNLHRLHSLAFRIEETVDDSVVWSGHGRGDITVSGSEDALHVHEKGQFSSQYKSDSTAYRNVYCWQWLSGRLALAHARFGIEAPVHLLDFVPDDDTTLTSVQPHQCGQDQYDASIHVLGDSLIIDWDIRGPRKNTHISSVYRSRMLG